MCVCVCVCVLIITISCHIRYNESLQKVKSTENVRGLTSGVSLGIIYFLIFTCYAIGFW